MNVETEESPEQESWCRELKGALVHFGNGAAVAKVNFPSDFSAVRISNLGQNTTPASIIRLLASHGFAVAEDCIRIINNPSATASNNTVADVRVEDPHFARRLCTVLKSGDKHTAPRATAINAPMPQTTNTRRVDSRKVYCSWHKPSRTAWLNFGGENIANSVATGFSTGRYTVLGQRIPAASPKGGVGGRRNPLSWSVVLSDVPPTVRTGSDIMRVIPPNLAPRHIELSPITYDGDLSLANAMIESLLLQAGPLEWWQGAQDGTAGKRFKAKARFTSDQDASEAVGMFHGKPVPFNPNGKLTVQLVHSARLKVSARVFQAVEEQLEVHQASWKAQHLLYIVYPPAQGLRVIKIEGEVDRDVASAKATVERILEGDVVQSDDGSPLWTSSLHSNGSDYQRLKQIEREHDVAITRDRRKSRLRLLGHPEACRRARMALQNLVAEADAQAATGSIFAIELSAQQFSQAFRGGYRAVAEAVGEDKVTLDVVSTPRRILVSGTEADLALAKQVLEQQHGEGGTSVAEQHRSVSPGDCAVCWTEAEDPVSSACGHLYCGDCFGDMCLAGAGAADGIGCQGGNAACGAVIPLTDLQMHLSTATLEDVLEAAFAAHVARHPADMRHCPTPDCGQLYRVHGGAGGGGTPAVFKCPACLGTVCTACGVGHAGLTCAEQRDLGAGGRAELQATRKKLGIKDCPRCGVMMEKRDGCNHMTCSCGAHICWVCMKTFDSGKEVYPHMSREHGGIGLDEFRF